MASVQLRRGACTFLPDENKVVASCDFYRFSCAHLLNTESISVVPATHTIMKNETRLADHEKCKINDELLGATAAAIKIHISRDFPFDFNFYSEN